MFFWTFKKTCSRFSLNYLIKISIMISEGSCDTDEWSNGCWQFSFAITEINCILKLGVGDMAKISYHVFLEISRFHDSLSCWFNYFIWAVQPKCFPIIKTNLFKITKYKKEWWIFRLKWAKVKNLCHYFIFVIQNKRKDTHNIQIKQTVLYFQVI